MTLISRELRDAVVRRARELCEYCQLPQVTQVGTFPVDHVTPVTAGGRTELGNLALACPRCNAAKWTRTVGVDPQSGRSVRLFDPRRDHWNDHFQWSSNDRTWLEARSPEAAATIALLELNSEHRRKVRHWLVELGLHPPDEPGA